MPLKLSSFNCRGIQDSFKRKKVFHYLKSIGCDIVFLQETHSSLIDENLWKTHWGEQAWFNSYASNSRGVAILIRNSISVDVKSIFRDPDGRVIIISASLNGFPFILANVYAPNSDCPEFFLDTFAQLDKFDNDSLIFAGDLNLALSSLDYQGSRDHHSNVNSSKIVTSLMDEFNLVDVWRHFHPNLRRYTRHQHNPRAMSRLDYILISEKIIGSCQNSKILPGVNSDHSVVTLFFEIDPCPCGKGYWKLNCQFLHHDSDFINFIKDRISDFKSVHKDTECNPNSVWDAFKCSISGYCIEYTSRKKKERFATKEKLIKEIDEIQNKIDSLGSSNKDDHVELDSKLHQLQDELSKILDFETNGLIIRSRCRWTEEGEKSSKYFCNLEKRSCERKSIHRIELDDQSVITDKQVIFDKIHEFYTNLYSTVDDSESDQTDDINSFLNSLNIPKLSDNEKNIMDQPITKNEIFRTLSSMTPNKSPGFDGLPLEFYIVFWNDICDMLINSYNYSFENGLLSLSQRNGVVTLIPKKDKSPLKIKNYRPISLLSVDYKIIAKTMANRLKKFMGDLIHNDQSGFLKGRNIGNNIRLLLDVIDYTEANEIPAAILSLDIEKAFDNVSHNFLFKVLEHFNFGENFLQWVRTFYSCRKAYVINNGFISNSIFINNGIFQGCPISPYLFLFVIETLGISIRNNPKIQGIKVNDEHLKLSMLADDTTCFLNGSLESFDNLFSTLDMFAVCSGCKANLSKSGAIWIGAKKGCSDFPYQDKGLQWNSDKFKTLGINFSLNIDALYNLNYKVKLEQIEQTLNCWRARNLSLLGKICVIKSLVLPQLLYLFSALCIKIPDSFFKKINTLFFKFIWNGGNDRVKRDFMYLDYNLGGLRMVNPYYFAQAQKLVWVKHLLDDNFSSVWKLIENSALESFHNDSTILWKSHAPEKILSHLKNTQVADSLRSWYLFRERAAADLGLQPCEYVLEECLWFNKYIRSKSRQYYYYDSWYERGIFCIADLLYDDNPTPVLKSFDDLIIEFDIPYRDTRRYNILMNNIVARGLLDDASPGRNFDSFDIFVNNLILAPKVPRYSYSIMIDKTPPEKAQCYWKDLFSNCVQDEDLEWELIHTRNYKCTIETQLRSFYFKIFHRAIAFNEFLFKIGRKDSPLCSFCGKFPESFRHVFCECDKVKPLWISLQNLVNSKLHSDYTFNHFEIMFGISYEPFLSYLILCCKFFIYKCKFQNVAPKFTAFKSFLIIKRATEYHIARKKGKLSNHFRKWNIDFN